jgi:hypothetical protein
MFQASVLTLRMGVELLYVPGVSCTQWFGGTVHVVTKGHLCCPPITITTNIYIYTHYIHIDLPTYLPIYLCIYLSIYIYVSIYLILSYFFLILSYFIFSYHYLIIILSYLILSYLSIYLSMYLCVCVIAAGPFGKTHPRFLRVAQPWHRASCNGLGLFQAHGWTSKLLGRGSHASHNFPFGSANSILCIAGTQFYGLYWSARKRVCHWTELVTWKSWVWGWGQTRTSMCLLVSCKYTCIPSTKEHVQTCNYHPSCLRASESKGFDFLTSEWIRQYRPHCGRLGASQPLVSQ